jgi:hypothetical protein
MLRPTTRRLLATFIEYAATDRVTAIEWNRFAVDHYHDEVMEAARRMCVRLLMERPASKSNLEQLYSIAADLRASDPSK